MNLTAIIPTYNESRYIARCLASLQKQQLDFHDTLEIIVVDDGSADGTSRIIKKFKQVSLFHQDHRGPAVARNTGAKYAKGEILLFLDADMEFDSKFVKFLVDPIKSGYALGTFSKEEYVANWENWVARSWNWNEDLPPKRRLPWNYPDLGTDFRAIKKSEFDKIKGFSEGGYTDSWSLFRKLGYKPVNAPGAVFYHYNPSTLNEAYHQARWVGKREYKLGIVGSLIAIVRSSFLMSILLGLYKSFKYREPFFLLYKITWDLGICRGILEMILTGRTAK